MRSKCFRFIRRIVSIKLLFDLEENVERLLENVKIQFSFLQLLIQDPYHPITQWNLMNPHLFKICIIKLTSVMFVDIIFWRHPVLLVEVRHPPSYLVEAWCHPVLIAEVWRHPVLIIKVWRHPILLVEVCHPVLKYDVIPY